MGNPWMGPWYSPFEMAKILLLEFILESRRDVYLNIDVTIWQPNFDRHVFQNLLFKKKKRVLFFISIYTY